MNQSDKHTVERLLEIMAALRNPDGGCPWDLEQTFETIAPYTIEEAYEVADAIERKALDELRDELGDLLLQVVYHARLAAEAGAFDFADVVDGICDKMVRRHPHVFADETVEGSREQSEAWETLKRQEQDAGSGNDRVLDGVPVGLPGLTRAVKLTRRAARVGFDWPSLAGVRAKVGEELSELDDAVADGDGEASAREMGDLLLAVANLCRHLDLDPESCARQANLRFERRFAQVEDRVREAGGDWEAFDLDALDRFWVAAKLLDSARRAEQGAAPTESA